MSQSVCFFTDASRHGPNPPPTAEHVADSAHPNPQAHSRGQGQRRPRVSARARRVRGPPHPEIHRREVHITPDISSNTVSSARQKRSARTLFKHCRLTRDDPAFPADKAPRLAPRWSRASLTASRNARLRGRSCPGSISASPRRGSTPTDSPSAPRTTGSWSSTPAGPERRASRSRCRPGFSNPRGRSGWRRGACRPRRRPCRPA